MYNIYGIGNGKYGYKLTYNNRRYKVESRIDNPIILLNQNEAVKLAEVSRLKSLKQSSDPIPTPDECIQVLDKGKSPEEVVNGS